MGAAAEVELVSADVLGALPAGWDAPRTGRLVVPVPPGYALDRVARSHGWSGLAPTAYDRRTRTLHRVLALPQAGARGVAVAQRASGLVVSWGGGPLSTVDRRAVAAQVSRMLAVTADLRELHAVCAGHPDLYWVPAAGAGALLRSPTVWEDLAKTLATTNCSWALTRLICTRLVDTLGAVGEHAERAFPTPEAVRDAGAEHLRDVVRVGYRAQAFLELAGAVADGALDPEAWWDPELSDHHVLLAIRALRGFGPYAAEGMLALLDRPRGLALDSWVRAKLPRLLGRAAMTDAEIAERYAPLGRWAGTGRWLELPRDWFAG
jgi:N-glycosylase/DNA lyase